MPEYSEPLISGGTFHLYNHAVAKENLFHSEADYTYFLKKMELYISPVADILAYCLLPNHYHLLINVKSEKELIKYLSEKVKHAKTVESRMTDDTAFLNKQVSQAFSNFFNTYAKHYNSIYNRIGTLFKRTFRRKAVDTKDYLQQVICYIHQNPLAAGFVKDISEWEFSSYNQIVEKSTDLVNSEMVIEIFDDLENFIFCHKRIVELD